MSSPTPDDLLSAHYDREVTPSEESTAKSLAANSLQAARELRDYNRLSQLMQALPKQAAPPEFAAAVMQRAERESLIPLDSVTSPARSGRELESRGPALRRRRWILAAATSGAVAATALVVMTVANRSTPQTNGDAVAVSDVARHAPTRETELRRLSEMTSGPRVVEAKDAELDASRARGLMIKRETRAKVGGSAGKADKAVAASPPKSAVESPLVAKGSSPHQAGIARKQSASTQPGQNSGMTWGAPDVPFRADQEFALRFPADLKTAKVGDVVEALEQDGKQVAIVRLTVVNQAEGLDGIQNVLVRNASRTLKNGEEIKRLQQRFSDRKVAEVQKSAKSEPLQRAPGDLICVYMEGTRTEMLGVLHDLQNESHIQEAQLTNTIPISMFEQYAGQGIPFEQEQAADKAKNTATQSTSNFTLTDTNASQMTVSLSPATVDKILTANQQTPRVWSSKKGGNKLAPQESEKLDELNLSQQMLGNRSNEKGKRRFVAASPAPALQTQQNVPVAPAQQAAPVARYSVAPQSPDTNSAVGKPHQMVVAPQRPFQVFFVITDQPLSQSAAQAKKPTFSKSNAINSQSPASATKAPSANEAPPIAAPVPTAPAEAAGKAAPQAKAP